MTGPQFPPEWGTIRESPTYRHPGLDRARGGIKIAIARKFGTGIALAHCIEGSEDRITEVGR